MKNNLNFEFKKTDGKFKNIGYSERQDNRLIQRVENPKQRRSLYELRERLEKKERRENASQDQNKKW